MPIRGVARHLHCWWHFNPSFIPQWNNRFKIQICQSIDSGYHSPSFASRERRTVNPLMASTRYNFLYSPQGRPLARQRHDGHRSRSAARTPRSWAGGSKRWQDPTRPASSGSASSSNDHHPHGSYYYLQFLGVAPGRQGQGIGAALMAPVLKRCDREGMRAYLDATSERSKTLYERHGFEAEAAFALPGGPPLWPMWRWPALGR
jgi:GNAT superfamily N-acetyltransferase